MFLYSVFTESHLVLTSFHSTSDFMSQHLQRRHSHIPKSHVHLAVEHYLFWRSPHSQSLRTGGHWRTVAEWLGVWEAWVWKE